MSNNIGLGKAYRIIRNINCCICLFCAFFCGIDIPRMMNGLAANPYSLFGFPLFLIALWGIYKLEKGKRIGVVFLLLGEIIGGLCIGADPDHPSDAIPVMIMFGVISVLQIMAIDWKTFLNSE